jgi:hypothetical protein
MRPPAIEKMGYFPTSPLVYDLLKTWFAPAETGRLLDPCAGEGTAAAALGHALACETLGVELSPVRAAKAAPVLDRVHNAPWSAVSLTPESITFLFLNPPYHHDRFGEHKRLELEFLRSSTHKLVKGGALVYIVPLPLLGMDEVAAHLAGYYENFILRRYPETVFNQVVVIAVKRQKYKVPAGEEINAIRAWAANKPSMLESAAEPVYDLLPAPDKGQGGQAIRFTRLDYEPEELVDATRTRGVHGTAEWRDLTNPNHANGKFTRPLMPLKKGHIAMLMASGMMGTIPLRDEDGRPMHVKGRVVKIVEKVSTKTSKDGKQAVDTYRDRFVTTVAVVRQTGIEIIDKVEPLAKFMHKYGDQLGAHILATYLPLYNFDPTPEEAAVLDTLARTARPLPGQEKAGLLPTQRHVAAAVARGLQSLNDLGLVANIQGEMGVGKSKTALAAAALVGEYPVLVVADPHMCPKWAREIEETIPGAKAMEIVRIGKNAEDPADVNDVRRFFQLAKSGRLGPKPFAVVAHTSAKMSAGWQHAYSKRYLLDEDGKAYTALCCPDCGRPIEVNFKGDVKIIARREKDLGDKRLFCAAAVTGYKLDPSGRIERDGAGLRVWGERECGAPLFKFEGRRVSIAEYIAKHAKGRFKILITDEVHKFKGKSSDRSIAFHQLVGAVGHVITLTGTYFGGPSTSIFWLLHRTNAGVRQDFAFSDEKRWATLYGVLETERARRRDEVPDEDGETGNRRYANQAKEKPGISPAIVNRLLGNTVFLSLKDLGLALPPYAEEVVRLEMEEEQADQYHSMQGYLRSLAIQDRRLLSTWLQWSLARPNSCFRDEEVKVIDRSEIEEAEEENGDPALRTKVLMTLPTVVSGSQSLPKEAWLADFCHAERQQGRKVLIYMRQTGTRDIQDRILGILQAKGVRATILSGAVEPRKREAWIAGRAYGLDALIVNPKLVETGLDLIQFSSVVFFEIEYSLYTLWQAVRRVWRLGQTKAVKAVFAVYAGTMEATALALMGQKMKAAQLLYGDEVGGAIVPEDDGDTLMKLARAALDAAELPDLQRLFADEVTESHSPLGSPTLPSAPLPVPTVPEIVSLWEWVEQNSGLVTPASARKRGAPKVLESQKSLF